MATLKERFEALDKKGQIRVTVKWMLSTLTGQTNFNKNLRNSLFTPIEEEMVKTEIEAAEREMEAIKNQLEDAETSPDLTKVQIPVELKNLLLTAAPIGSTESNKFASQVI